MSTPFLNFFNFFSPTIENPCYTLIKERFGTMRKYNLREKEIILGTIGKRIKTALEVREMKAIDLARATGMSKSSISQYMSGKNDPKQDKIYAMAKVLDVNPVWLMGFDVPMESVVSIDATKAESLLVTDYRKLDEADRNKLQGFLAALLSDEKYAKKRTVG